jgi:hypothetical protein
MDMKAMRGIFLYSYPYLNQQKHFVLLIIVYTLSSTKLEIRAEQFLPRSEGGGGQGGAGGKREWVWGRGGYDPNIICTYE